MTKRDDADELFDDLIAIGVNCFNPFQPGVGVFPAVIDFVRKNGLAVFDILSGQGHVRHLVLRQGKRTGELMAILVTAELPGTDLGVPAVVYVSCKPASLARDLRGFLNAGYKVKSISPFDLFPHTPHLETLAVMVRSTPALYFPSGQ